MLKIVLMGLVLPSVVHAAPEGIFEDGFDPAGCPTTIATYSGQRTLFPRTYLTYGVYPASRPNVYLLEWDNVWGYNDTTASFPVPWPGVGGSAPVIRQFPRAAYFGSHFRTPPDMSTFNGHFSNPSYVAGPNVTMAISQRCGDFQEWLPTDGCLALNVPTSDANLVLWKGTPNAPLSWCNLVPDTDYYVNVMFDDPMSTDQCSPVATKCVLGTVSYR